MNYSSLRRRLLAFIIDIFLVGGITTFGVIAGMTAAYPDGGAPENTIFLILLPFAVIWVYFLVGYSLFQTTIGKKLLHIKLVHKSGSRMNPAMILLREIFKIFSLPILNGLLSAWHSKERRTWYDVAAGSTVVRTDSDSDSLSLKDTKKFIKNNKVLSIILLLIVLFIVSVVYSGKDYKHVSNESETATYKSQLKAEVDSYTFTNIENELTEAEYAATYQESVKNLAAHMESVGKMSQDKEKLMSMVVLKDAKVLDPFIEHIAAIQAEYKKMSMLKVPAKYADLNADYVSALKDYADGTGLLVEIFDDNDNAEDISNRSVTLIESGTNKISAMGKKYGN